VAVSQESTKPIRCEFNRSQCDEVAFWPWLKKVPKMLRDRHLGWRGSYFRYLRDKCSERIVTKSISLLILII
jgi:hypothetical protein